MKWLFLFFSLPVFTSLYAQEGDSLDWDIDSVFDERPALEEDPPAPPVVPEPSLPSMDALIRQRGFTFNASYDFLGGIAPGWREALWIDTEDHGYYLDRYIRMRTSLDLDARISEVFRVKTTIQYQIPDFKFTLGDFFFDYNILDAVFVRGGKYDLSWGISPNFNYTNLLSRIPENGPSGSSYILKADIPSGIGGFQFLTLTRVDLLSASPPLLKITDFGYGAKYNLALPAADFNLGAFYKDDMPFRSFLSIKTTLWNTDFYGEGMLAVNFDEASGTSGAFNFGFAKSFFESKLTVNGELFQNFEKGAYRYNPETGIREAGESLFVEGFNGALNLRYSFEGGFSPAVFIQALYAPLQDSARLVPGFSFSPLPNMEFYCAVPMSLGSKDGYYYNNTLTVDSSNAPIPFCVILMLRLNGSVQFAHYF